MAVGVVCHDAGGAEILSSWVSSVGGGLVAASGPALQIFQRKIRDCRFVSINKAVAESDWLICGSSQDSNFELEAIKKARLVGKKTVTFLDHWVNYKERFIRTGDLVLPDEIWVGDKIAEKLALEALPNVPIVLVTNPLYAHFLEEYEAAHMGQQESSGGRFLYIGEPAPKGGLRRSSLVNFDVGRSSASFDAVKFFLDNVKLLKARIDSIIVRPHPSENAEIYRWAETYRSEYSVVVSVKNSLAEQIAGADIVVGLHSMAMVLAKMAGKRVICAIPPGHGVCQLPGMDFEYLRTIKLASENDS